MQPRPQKPSSTLLLPRGVRRALDAMRANVSRDWSVVDLAAAAGVSSRTLQRQFKMFLHKTPGAALRDMRFDCARRELLQSSTDVKVMDLALRCGFAHCGRFSIEYRHRYGETPSQTLKRQAVFTGVLATMPSIFAVSRDRLTLVLEPIEASPENGEIARLVADELATALTRAGVTVARQPRAARYRLAGVMRGWSWQTRLTLRLIESDTGRHLWAHCADGAIGEDSAPREHLATRIAAAIQPCLRLAEIDRAQQKPDGELGSHDLALRAMPGVLSLDAGGNARALDLLERAMELDPDHALSTALAAWAHAQRVVYHFTSAPAEERARSADLAHKAQALATDATVLAVLGNALTLVHDLEAADLVIRKALSVDGGSAWAWSRSGWIDLYKGDAELGHRAVQDRARPRAARFLRLQQPGRHRLCAFRGRPLSTTPPSGRSARSPSIRRRTGSIAPSVPPMCWAAPSSRPSAASPPCRTSIPISPCWTCRRLCRRCRRATAIAFSTRCAPSACPPRPCLPPGSGALPTG